MPERAGSRPTIRDVAKLAGVSTATVSYVLNGTGSVSSETAARVRDCVAELGYRANTLAIAHRTGRSATIGLALPDLTNPFFPEFAQGVHTAASAAGYSVLLLDGHNSADQLSAGVDRLADRVPEGLIYCPVDDAVDDRLHRFPTVMFDRRVEGLDSVRADLEGGGAMQAELVASYGHRRVGLISGPEGSETAQLRRAGLLGGLPDEVEVVWEFFEDFTLDFTEPASAALKAGGVTCVLTANDIQAIATLRHLRSAGHSVPDDVSVIGFDNIGFAALVSPSLTTIDLRARSLGAASFELLVSRIADRDLPARHEVLNVAPIERESLGPLGRQAA